MNSSTAAASVVSVNSAPEDSPDVPAEGADAASAASAASFCSPHPLASHSDAGRAQDVSLGECIGKWANNVENFSKHVILDTLYQAVDGEVGDIDVVTGLPQAPPEHPPSFPNPETQNDPNSRRKSLQTSEYYIDQEIRARRNLTRDIQRQMQQDEIKQEGTQSSSENDNPGAACTEAPCTLRPVSPADYEGIAKIMELERKQARSEIMSSREITADDIERVAKYCHVHSRPFVVALRSDKDLLDRSKWPLGSDKQYHAYVEFIKTLSKQPPELVGFAFVSETRISPLNQPCPGSRYSGQLRVVVHPDHRRKLYGTALVDRILRCVSSSPRKSISYEWQCKDEQQIYAEPALGNLRPYVHLYVEMITETDHPEYGWKARMLDQHGFTRVMHLPKAVETDKGGNEQWLDLSLWQLDCHHHASIPVRSASSMVLQAPALLKKALKKSRYYNEEAA